MPQDSTVSYSATRSVDGGVLSAAIVLGLQCARPLAASRLFALHELDELALGRASQADGCTAIGVRAARLEWVDPWASSRHARLARGEDGWSLQDLGSKNGSYVNGQRCTVALLEDGDVLELGGCFFVFREAIPLATAMELGDNVRGEPSAATLCAEAHAARKLIEQIAASKISLLISGETGSGKELAARAIHEASGRKGRLCAINCAAIPSSLAESELFGHLRGAFSGAAADRMGLVQAADGGTLFLDEVGELSLELQSKLLRVLQEHEVLPLGATRPIPVDLRVVSATHRRLPEDIVAGRFREDLLARLAACHVQLPALRQRREDIGLLVQHVLREHLGPRAEETLLQRAVGRALYAFDWPQNVRQLRHALEVASELSRGSEIGLQHLPDALREAAESAPHQKRLPLASEPLKQRLLELMNEHRGNVSAVARGLSRSRVQVRRWCQRFAIDPETFREK